MDSSAGRREENKQRTRSSLERAAARLFEENGFAATTVREIANAAGVGERTFFRYFPSKDDLVLQQVRNLIPGVMDLLRARPAQESLLTALREAVVDWLVQTGAPPTILITGAPKGSDRYLVETHALKEDLESAITEAFLDRLAAAGEDREAGSTRLRAVVQAGAGVSALRGLLVAFPANASDGDEGASKCAPASGLRQHARHQAPPESDVPAAAPAPTAAETIARVREAFAALEP
jgi:AcrR family transcriptional regulator